jgi:hypothetical protein
MIIVGEPSCGDKNKNRSQVNESDSNNQPNVPPIDFSRLVSSLGESDYQPLTPIDIARPVHDYKASEEFKSHLIPPAPADNLPNTYNSQTNDSNDNGQPSIPPIDFTPIQPAWSSFVTVGHSNARFEEDEKLPSTRAIPVRRVSLMLPNSVDSGQFIYVPNVPNVYNSVRGELSSVRQTPNNSQKSTPVVKAVATSSRNKPTNVQQLQQQKKSQSARVK